MNTISLLVAASTNNAIGKDGQLLWHLPRDLKYFKDLTWGMPVVMGRKTFESVNKPLPGRINIVITSNKSWSAENVQTATTIGEAIELAKATNCKEIFIIGGGEIYKQTMPTADRIYMTRVHAAFDADTFFPVIDSTQWHLAKSNEYKADEKNKYDMSFEVWEKRSI